VLVEVGMGVGGTNVLVEAGTVVSVEGGIGVLVGMSAGRGVPQADKIKTRAIEKLTGKIFFIGRAFFDILIYVPGSKISITDEASMNQSIN